jgi:hypothetical protein
MYVYVCVCVCVCVCLHDPCERWEAHEPVQPREVVPVQEGLERWFKVGQRRTEMT